MIDVAKEIAEGSAYFAEHQEVTSFCVVGSACYAPDPKDVDFVVLIEGKEDFLAAFRALGLNSGWVPCTGEEYDMTAGTWGAFRSGHWNMILTTDPRFYEAMLVGSAVCTALALPTRDERVKVHEAVREVML